MLYPGRTPLSVNLNAGHYGVELFFIISGFVILMTIERKNSVLDFATSRFTRLMPAFLAAMLLATVILTVHPMPPLHTPTILQFLANLTMAPSLFGETGIDLPYWTLTYELVFYVLMALVLWFRQLHRIEELGLGLLALGIIGWTAIDLPAHHRLVIVLMVYYSNFFLIGLCLYRLFSGMARPITWVALACAVAASARGGGPQAFDTGPLDYLLLTVAFATLVWFATSRYGRWIAWRPLLFLGCISYPLYLVHVAVGYQVILFGVIEGWSTLAGVLAAGLVSLLVAALIYYLVERPVQRWLHRLQRRTRASASMPQGAE